LQPNWQVVVAALERLHQAHKRLRALTTPQLATLTHGRLAGERGQSGRYRKLLTRDGDGCVWCGKSLAGGSETTLEHILPRGLGGPDTLANTMCACGDCNNRRQEMRVGAWVATCEYRGLKPRRAALEAVLNGLVAMGGREAVAAQRELDVLGSGMGRRRRPVTARSPMRRWR
jgi:hypothetical protein